MGLLSGNGLWIYHLPLQKPLIVLWVYPPRLLLSLKCNCPPPRRRNIEKFDRPLYAQIWKRIISSGHRTTDGSTADLYYIPVDFRYLGWGRGGAGWVFVRWSHLKCAGTPPSLAVPARWGFRP